MSQATVFIGSSSEGLEVARAISEGLECCADPVIWDEDVFEFGRGYLEELVGELEKHDFALLVLTPDDVTESRGDSQKSPRDNVLFECGLFMGRLGRERTFIVCDRSTKLKLPSDLAGITLITYDGNRMAEAPSSAVRGACMRINRVIKKPEFRELTGEWRSRYLLCFGGGEPLVEEAVTVRSARGMLCIESKNNPKNDNYVAYARQSMGKHFVGEWKSVRYAATAGGAFFLTVHPQGNLMYGYFTSPNDDHKVTHGGWVMAKVGMGDIMAKMEKAAKDGEKKDGENKTGETTKDKMVERELNKLLDKGVRILKDTAPVLTKLKKQSGGGNGTRRSPQPRARSKKEGAGSKRNGG